MISSGWQCSVPSDSKQTVGKNIVGGILVLLVSCDLLAIPVVDIHNREAVRQLYNQEYLASEGVESGWSGNIAECEPGMTDWAYRDAIVRRINYFRSMAGVKANVVLSEAFNQQAQAAALMMSANDSLSHSPSSNWDCYTLGGWEAAHKGNLGLNVHGPQAITLLIEDSGGNNRPVGHRRWIYYPQTQTMGTGDVVPNRRFYKPAHTTLVQDEHLWDERPATRDGFISWPTPGFIPHQLVFARWSLSYANADFSNASVRMTDSNGQAIDLEVVYRSEAPRPDYVSAPEQTITWEPMGINPADALGGNDVDYHVIVNNVILNGRVRSFKYTVTAIDPAVSLDNSTNPDFPDTFNQPFMELGSVPVNHHWFSLPVPADISKPVVLLGPPTTNGVQPGVMQVRNPKDNAAIEVRFREWYGDFIHATEWVDYLMVEEGVHHFPDGTQLQVARFPISGSKRWKSVKFAESFDGTPHVFALLQTARGADTASLRINRIDVEGFQVALFEQEKTVHSGHVQEEAAYFAFYHPHHSGVIAANGVDIDFDLQSFSINHRWTEVFGATIRIEEETSRDKETKHGFETINTLQFAQHFFAQISSFQGPDTCVLRRR